MIFETPQFMIKFVIYTCMNLIGNKQPIIISIFTDCICADNFPYEGLEFGVPPEEDIRETLLTAFINFRAFVEEADDADDDDSVLRLLGV